MLTSVNAFKSKFRSVSTNRLVRVKKNLDSHNFLYFGETPEKKLEFFRNKEKSAQQATSNPHLLVNPSILNNKTSSKAAKSARKFPPNRNLKLTTEKYHRKLVVFKRKVFQDKSPKKKNEENAEIYIEQLVSVPIADRIWEKSVRHKTITPNPVSKVEILTPNKGTKEKINRKEQQLVLVHPDEMILYCDPLTIDDTESPSPVFKPRYL